MSETDWSIVADYHTHTQYSHGQGTVFDNAEAARRRGLKTVAITDHGPGNFVVGIDAGRGLSGMLADVARASGNDLTVLAGIEANIVSQDGRLDLSDEDIDRLDILLCGLHPGTRLIGVPRSDRAVSLFPFPALTRPRRQHHLLRNTKAMIEALYRNDIDILTHPGLYYPVDTAEVARACARTDTLFEINSGHCWPPVSMLRTAARSGVEFVLSSDAHHPLDVGDVSAAEHLAARAGIVPDRIANVSTNARAIGNKRKSAKKEPPTARTKI